VERAESAHYVDRADHYDRQLAPFTGALLEQVRLIPHRLVLEMPNAVIQPS
jgi:hypothetical protein